MQALGLQRVLVKVFLVVIALIQVCLTERMGVSWDSTRHHWALGRWSWDGAEQERLLQVTPVC